MYKMTSKITRVESSLVDGNTLATNLCVVYFALDVYYSNADIVLIGENQKEFFKSTQNVIQLLQFTHFQILKKLNLRQPIALILPEISGTNNKRMSSSQSQFHLEPFDTLKNIRQKISQSFCEPGNLNNNIALKLAKMIVFPLANGGNLRFFILFFRENFN